MGSFHAIHKRGRGEVVIAKSTGKPLSKHPMTPAKAHAQLAAIEMRKHGTMPASPHTPAAKKSIHRALGHK